MAYDGYPNALSSMVAPANGASTPADNTGKGKSGGVRGAGGGRGTLGSILARASQQRPPAARAPRAPGGIQQGQPQQQQPQPRRMSATNPPLGTAPPIAPRPGLKPPYPDARSPQPQIMPNGVPVMPTPRPPVGALPPRVPATFAPNLATAQPPNPPSMPPIAQTPMPQMSGAMQMPHLPPGGAPMPIRPGQAPQGLRQTRRPGMSGMMGL